MISAWCFHDRPGVFTKWKNLIRQPLQASSILRIIDRCLHNFTHRLENSHCALAFGHIDTKAFIWSISWLIKFMATAFTHCLFNLLVYYMNALKDGGTICLNRMLRMWEAADRLIYERANTRWTTSDHFPSHSNNFDFEMEMEIDMAACCAYDRNFIVGGGPNVVEP